MLLRIGQGAFTGTITASAALIAGVTPRRYVGLALGMIYGAVSGGMAIGPLVAGILADRYSFRATFLVASAVLLVAGILVVACTREEFTPPPIEQRRQSMSLKTVLVSGGFLTACIICFLASYVDVWAAYLLVGGVLLLVPPLAMLLLKHSAPAPSQDGPDNSTCLS